MFLTISALLLLIVIAVQNYLYPSLREETISDGLYGPYHWFLDGAYVVLAIALGLAFDGKGLAETLAFLAGGALIVTAITNTFSTWVDKLKPGLHTKLHTWFSIGMFLSMLGLQATQNHGWMWGLSAAGIVIPTIVAGFLTTHKSLGILAGPAAEKTAVLFLCVWLILWSFVI
jgi:hypothetical protein